MPETTGPAWADEVASQVVTAIGEFARGGRTSIVPSDQLERDLGIDSLEFVRLVQLIEEATDIVLDDRETAGVSTVADLVAVVRQAIKSKPVPTA